MAQQQAQVGAGTSAHHMAVDLVRRQHTPELMALLADTPKLTSLDYGEFDALLICGGQSPMFTFPDNAGRQEAVRAFYEAEKITGSF